VRTLAVALLMMRAYVPAVAAQPDAWSFELAAPTYFLPHESDYVQPTLTADRGALHLEGRYNYEDRESVSGFAGWNFETGSKLSLALTPMLGGVVGNTDGVIPACELTLGYGLAELYAENEYVIDLNESSDSFFYNWSELSFSATRWLSGGLVTQRSRIIHTSRDLQRGPFVGVTAGPIEATGYFFNPGSDDHYFVASIGATF